MYIFFDIRNRKGNKVFATVHRARRYAKMKHIKCYFVCDNKKCVTDDDHVIIDSCALCSLQRDLKGQVCT